MQMASLDEQGMPEVATRGLLATDHVILNHGQVTWTTPELAPLLLTTTPHLREDVSALDRFNVHRCPTRRVFSGTGLEPVTKQATVRYLYHSATAATDLRTYCIRKIWRKNKTALEPKNVLPTLKHGGENVMVWVCVAHNGAGNLAFIDNKMNALAYIDVLRHNLLDSAKKLSMENIFIVQQDNDPKHTAIVTKIWLLYHAPRRLETLPQSPDLNPIEYLWKHLDTEVREKNVTSKENLKEKLQEVWNSINTEITKKLIESIPRRIEAVIKANRLFKSIEISLHCCICFVKVY
ncbi:transposable element Tcb2 transposase [Trichonephila clavipes]|nr:transposable element Tcb2 transposase [Trichonephila clavipes]